MFEPYLVRWGLTPDGDPIATDNSNLLPVRRGAVPAMLKIAREDEERWGALLMMWWNGDGAAQVLAYDSDALLLERATGTRSLADIARNGRDDEATSILCDVAKRLHTPRPAPPPPGLLSLTDWFEGLWAPAAQRGGILLRGAAEARRLLGEPRDVVVLHGDLHHGNILDGGSRGWLAIDPKRLRGERAFDFANIFRNPDRETAMATGRLERRLDVVSGASNLDRVRLLRWILALTSLSAAWILSDGDAPTLDLAVAEQVIAILDRDAPSLRS